jgi:hypothetical protein
MSNQNYQSPPARGNTRQDSQGEPNNSFGGFKAPKVAGAQRPFNKENPFTFMKGTHETTQPGFKKNDHGNVGYNEKGHSTMSPNYHGFTKKAANTGYEPSKGFGNHVKMSKATSNEKGFNKVGKLADSKNINKKIKLTI